MFCVDACISFAGIHLLKIRQHSDIAVKLCILENVKVAVRCSNIRRAAVI